PISTYALVELFPQGGCWLEELGQKWRAASETSSRIRSLSFVRRLRLPMGAPSLDHEKSQGA
ncbi:hypothetical protein THAOC_22949, partial [Thalassiosira oceanica]